MNQLTPRSQFTFVEQLGDPTDSGTYYVQCVVRYSASSVVIATINMTAQGNQRFTGTFTVPADVSGQGYYLDITTTIYTDSGYSQVSSNYQRTTSTFFVLQPVTNSVIGGNSGGYADDEELRKRLERIEAAILGIKIPTFKQKEIDLSRIESGLKELISRKSPVYDDAPLRNQIISVLSYLESMPKFEKSKPVDLYPLLERLQNIVVSHGQLTDSVKNILKEHIQNMQKSMGDAPSLVTKELLDGIEKTIDKKREDVFHIRVMPHSKQMDPRLKKLLSPYA